MKGPAMTEKDIFQELQAVEESVAQAKERLDGLTEYIAALKKKISTDIMLQVQHAKYTRFNPEFLQPFLDEPYIIIPKRMVKGKAVEWRVIVPRFIDFQLGWPERSTPSYNVFLVNQYSHYFADIPKELEEKFQLEPIKGLKVADRLLLTPDEDTREDAWRKYRKHFIQREGKEAIRVKRGHEFALIAQIIEDGALPFIPQPVEKQDLRPPETAITLRDYQKDGWKAFNKHGAVGIFWPFGTGKSYFGAYTCACLKGPKLVVVDTLTLKEQWLETLQKHTRIAHEVQVETYHAFHKVQAKEFTLVIYDECHRLPAKTFIRLATLKTKYRLGLSGSPYREDGRVNYIIALTGMPLGLAWEKFFDLGIIRKPRITVFVLKNLTAKREKLKDLLKKETGKTVIYCDGIKLGQSIARAHDLEFVYSETRDRLAKIRGSERIVVSRVGDTGISLPGLNTLIEIDFLFGSRMQESQRDGRLLHSKKKARNHYILMTELELEKYGKRLLALYGRGFRVNIVR